MLFYNLVLAHDAGRRSDLMSIADPASIAGTVGTHSGAADVRSLRDVAASEAGARSGVVGARSPHDVASAEAPPDAHDPRWMQSMP
jgi:hypothetical protein